MRKKRRKRLKYPIKSADAADSRGLSAGVRSRVGGTGVGTGQHGAPPAGLPLLLLRYAQTEWVWPLARPLYMAAAHGSASSTKKIAPKRQNRQKLSGDDRAYRPFNTPRLPFRSRPGGEMLATALRVNFAWTPGLRCLVGAEGYRADRDSRKMMAGKSRDKSARGSARRSRVSHRPPARPPVYLSHGRLPARPAAPLPISIHKDYRV